MKFKKQIENILTQEIEKHGKYNDISIIETIILSKDISENYIELLFEKFFYDDEINKIIAEAPNTPLHILENILNMDNVELIEKMAKNKNLPESIFEKIYDKGESSILILKNLTSNPSTPPSILEKIEENFRNLRIYILSNPNISASLIKKISFTDDISTLKLIVENQNTPEDVLEYIYKYDKKNQKVSLWAKNTSFLSLRLSENKNTPFYILEELLKNEELLEHVLSNQQIGFEILNKFKNSENLDVLSGIVSNKNTPTELIEEIALKNLFSYSIVHHALHNPNTTSKTFNLLFSEINNLNEEKYIKKTTNENIKPFILSLFAENKNTPKYILSEIYKLNNEGLNYKLVNNPNTPSYILEEQSKSESKKNINCVVANPNTPTKIIIDKFHTLTHITTKSLALENLISILKEEKEIELKKEIEEISKNQPVIIQSIIF